MPQISSLKLCVLHLLEFPNEIFRFSRIQFECLRQCMEISFLKYWDICGNNDKQEKFALSLFSKAWMALRLSSVSNELINLDMFCINFGKVSDWTENKIEEILRQLNLNFKIWQISIEQTLYCLYQTQIFSDKENGLKCFRKICVMFDIELLQNVWI